MENFRRKGYGTRAVKMILGEYPEYDVSLFVLSQNAPAKKFWEKVMTDRGFQDLAKAGKVKPPTRTKIAQKEAKTDFQYWKQKTGGKTK